jgi:hypothetical protein
MIQLYFLSILCNGLCGYIFFTGNDDSTDRSIKFSFDNPANYLVLGIISAITGFLKLLSPTENNVPIIGDIVPALAGIIAGFVLVFGIYRQDTTSSDIETGGTLNRLGEKLLKHRKMLGLALLVTALLHFLFPQALFL